MQDPANGSFTLMRVHEASLVPTAQSPRRACEQQMSLEEERRPGGGGDARSAKVVVVVVVVVAQKATQCQVAQVGAACEAGLAARA